MSLPPSSQFVANTAGSRADFSVPPAELTLTLSVFAIIRVRIIFGRVVVTRALLAFVRAHARAFMVDVTRLLTPRGSFAVMVAFVHLVHNFGVGKGKELLRSDRILIIRVFCQHGDVPIR